MEKKELYQKLVLKRKATCYPGYRNIGDYHKGAYECEHVSPYSLSAGNLDAEVMFFLQDLAGHEAMIKPVNEESKNLGHDPKLFTNVNLKKLLVTHLGLELSETFGTNLFPFIKSGRLSANLPVRDMDKAAVDFALPMVKIVKPRVVITFGVKTFNSLRVASGLKRVSNLDEAVVSNFDLYGACVHCLPHPGRIGTNNRNKGGVNRIEKDWEKVAATFTSGLQTGLPYDR